MEFSGLFVFGRSPRKGAASGCSQSTKSDAVNRKSINAISCSNHSSNVQYKRTCFLKKYNNNNNNNNAK